MNFAKTEIYCITAASSQNLSLKRRFQIIGDKIERQAIASVFKLFIAIANVDDLLKDNIRYLKFFLDTANVIFKAFFFL